MCSKCEDDEFLEQMLGPIPAPEEKPAMDLKKVGLAPQDLDFIKIFIGAESQPDPKA